MLLDPAAAVGVALEGRVVPDDDHPVLGEVHIGLDDIDSHPVGALEGGEGILWKVSAVATVGDDAGHRIEERLIHR